MDYYNYNELYHHGVKGMKWGVRRYQNKDGTLTDKGKERASKQYKKLSVEANMDLARSYNDRYINAYNKAANDMNNGLTEKYNRDYDKKLGSKAKGHDYLNDKEYNEGYEKLFQGRLNKYFEQETAKALLNNKNYKKAQELCDKYNMTSFDELARTNAEAVETARKLLGQG